MNKSQEDNIRVVCRFRPPNNFEKKNSELIGMGIEKNNTVKIKSQTVGDMKQPEKKFVFDYAFPTNTTQELVYDVVAKPVVEGVFDGWNGSILAYGQTSSGKTFTMQGILLDEKLKGIVPRLVDNIFNYISESPENLEFIVKIGMLEIYMEEIRDLLNPNSKRKVRIRQSPTKGIYLENLTEVSVVDELDVQGVYNQGVGNRKIGRTDMNAVSSRSHMLTIIFIQQKDTVENSIKRGKLYLIDLAGSEKVSKTNARGQALQEAKLINKSLLWLGNVINALTQGESFIPYRNSKLTKILQETLGGNSRTTLIVTCSPSIYNLAETISTLKFGVRAKTIKNKVTINEELSKEQLIANLKKAEQKIEQLEGHVHFLKNHIRNALGASVPTYKHKKATSKQKEEKRASLTEVQHKQVISKELMKEFEDKMKDANEKLEEMQKESQKLQEDLQGQINQNAAQNNKYDKLLQDFQQSQNQIAGYREKLIQQEEINKELKSVIDNFEKIEQQKEDALNKMNQVQLGNNNKNSKEVFKNFIENMPVQDAQKNMLYDYVEKLDSELELKKNQNYKLKTITENLLINYQSLVEKELPQLEKNHVEIVTGIKSKERAKNFLFNDKLVDVINQYIEKLDTQTKQIKFQEKTEKKLRDSYAQYKLKSKRKIHSLKNKIELLTKCVNISITKLEDYKTKNVEHPHLNLEINFNEFDEYQTNFHSANPVNELQHNLQAGTNVIKTIRGKRKVENDVESVSEEDDQIQLYK